MVTYDASERSVEVCYNTLRPSREDNTFSKIENMSQLFRL